MISIERRVRLTVSGQRQSWVELEHLVTSAGQLPLTTQAADLLKRAATAAAASNDSIVVIVHVKPIVGRWTGLSTSTYSQFRLRAGKWEHVGRTLP
jgi:hypothetical protein